MKLRHSVSTDSSSNVVIQCVPYVNNEGCRHLVTEYCSRERNSLCETERAGMFCRDKDLPSLTLGRPASMAAHGSHDIFRRRLPALVAG